MNGLACPVIYGVYVFGKKTVSFQNVQILYLKKDLHIQCNSKGYQSLPAGLYQEHHWV